MTSLVDARFDNRFCSRLAADPSDVNRPRQVPGAAFSRVVPTPTGAPEVIALADEVVDLLGIDPSDTTSDSFRDLVTGNAVAPGMDPFAMRYGGHQFGNWAGQLGDGRAINLGEMVTPDGSRQTLQLKGAGRTPYSRSADGLAVLRSSIREFLCSEAMHHLGVPTTRALSLALTGDQVMRDLLYDGHPALEPGAVVCRVAPTFIRFGNFELPASLGELDGLRAITEFTIREYFADLVPESGEIDADTVVAFYRRVVESTADLIVHWQRVGFVHGVMNTDNLSILGLTIDYGPYGWLEDYDPDWTPNTTDRHGRRYRFGNQPGIGQWNLAQLGNALHPLVGEADPLQEAIDAYVDRFRNGYGDMVRAKLGLQTWDVDDDESLAIELFDLLRMVETDMTILFRRLADVRLDDTAETEARFAPLVDAFYDPDTVGDDVRNRWHRWLDNYAARTRSEGTGDGLRAETMNAANPIYVMRNWLAQEAIDASTAGDHSKVAELLDVMRDPYTERPGLEHYASKRPDWARTRVGCSMLSCSS